MQQHKNRFVQTRWGKVRRVHAGTAAAGGDAAQWMADIEDVRGMHVNNCRVIGPRRPLEHSDERPSFALFGTMSGDLYSPWCIPCPWTSTVNPEDHKNYEMIDEYSDVTFRVHTDGTYTVGSRGLGEYIACGPGARQGENAATVRFFNGDTPVARAGDITEHGPDSALVKWMEQVEEVITTLLLQVNTLSGGQWLPPDWLQSLKPTAPTRVRGFIITGSPELRTGYDGVTFDKVTVVGLDPDEAV